jgi:cell wall-associated NlpC family hydrolase
MADIQRFVAPEQVQPGDILVVRHQNSDAGRIIRDGAALGDDPNVWDHVIIASHTDEAGTQWGIEGRNGGVGWVDLAPRIGDPWTVANDTQPKTDEQRAAVVATAKGMLGVPYDWLAIAVDALHAVAPLWKMRDEWGPGVPGHVVCSSLADYVYEHVGLPTPAADRFCTPAMWARFILRHEWQT